MSVLLPPDSCQDIIGFSKSSGLDPEQKSLTRLKNKPGIAKPPSKETVRTYTLNNNSVIIKIKK